MKKGYLLSFLLIMMLIFMMAFPNVKSKNNKDLNIAIPESEILTAYSIKFPWTTKINQLSLVNCVNYAPDVSSKISVELLGKKDESLNTSYDIPKNATMSFFVSEIKGFDDIKSKSGVVNVSTKSKNVVCYMNYYSYDKEDEIIETSNLEGCDITTGESNIAYNKNIYKGLTVKSAKLYIDNLSDEQMKFYVKGYSAKGEQIESYTISLARNGEKIITIKNKKVVTFKISPKLQDKKYLAFIKIKFTNGQKEILKSQKNFVRSNFVNAKGILVISNVGNSANTVTYEIYSEGELKVSNKISMEPFSQKNINLKKQVKSLPNPIIKLVTEDTNNQNCDDYTCEVSSKSNGIIGYVRVNNVANKLFNNKDSLGTDILIPYNFSLGETGSLRIFNEGSSDAVVNISITPEKLVTMTLKKDSSVLMPLATSTKETINGFLFVSSTKNFISANLVTNYQNRYKKESKGLVVSSDVSMF